MMSSLLPTTGGHKIRPYALIYWCFAVNLEFQFVGEDLVSSRASYKIKLIFNNSLLNCFFITIRAEYTNINVMCHRIILIDLHTL
jgi:glucose-6-phosphate-specific signal transduction histidine kinase